MKLAGTGAVGCQCSFLTQSSLLGTQQDTHKLTSKQTNASGVSLSIARYGTLTREEEAASQANPRERANAAHTTSTQPTRASEHPGSCPPRPAHGQLTLRPACPSVRPSPSPTRSRGAEASVPRTTPTHIARAHVTPIPSVHRPSPSRPRVPRDPGTFRETHLPSPPPIYSLPSTLFSSTQPAIHTPQAEQARNHHSTEASNSKH